MTLLNAFLTMLTSLEAMWASNLNSLVRAPKMMMITNSLMILPRLMAPKMMKIANSLTPLLRLKPPKMVTITNPLMSQLLPMAHTNYEDQFPFSIYWIV